VRVDTCPDEGIREDAVQRWVQAASRLQSNGDGIDVAVRDGRIVGVRGRAGDRVNHGRLDPRDCYGWRTIGSPDGLTRPLVRERGKLVEADWDDGGGS
jgi:anaerobic selenocysteine-containing dehydrogenase